MKIHTHKFSSITEARRAGYIPSSEAAELGGLSIDYLRRLSSRGQAPTPAKLGHGYWWNRAEIEKWAKGRPRNRRPGESPAPCASPGCRRQAVARGLCLMHYKQHRRQKYDTRRVGDPVGAGRWGILDETAEGLLCHECGKRFRSLAAHIQLAHSMKASEYRETYGLPRGTSLICQEMREQKRQTVEKHQLTQNLEKSRDPARASASRSPDVFDALSRSKRQRTERS